MINKVASNANSHHQEGRGKGWRQEVVAVFTIGQQIVEDQQQQSPFLSTFAHHCLRWCPLHHLLHPCPSSLTASSAPFCPSCLSSHPFLPLQPQHPTPPGCAAITQARGQKRRIRKDTRANSANATSMSKEAREGKEEEQEQEEEMKRVCEQHQTYVKLLDFFL